MQLAALAYDPVLAHVGHARGGQIEAVALVVDLAANLPDDRPTVMVAADDPDALRRLLDGESWPARAIWSAARADFVPVLERALGGRASARRGVRYYIGGQGLPHAGVTRQIEIADCEALDLTPCALSASALRNWIRRGWRVFGAVRDGALVCHALAAYPIGDTEEVSAVFTAPAARRQGLATAVAAAAADDIRARGGRPVYVCNRSNTASRAVAEKLGMALLYETAEIEID